MARFGDGPIEFKCPNPKCKQDIRLKYADIFNQGRAKCSRCGCEISFNSSVVANLRYAVSDYEKAQEKLSKATSEIMLKADIKYKT